MGCCKSQEIQKDTKDTLLQKDQQENSSSIDSNVNRGLSLQKSYSPFAGFLGLANEKNGNDGEIQPYQPPIIPQKQKIFQGKSIFKPPCFDDLRRSGWIDKRGHLVRNWKNRYIVLDHEEITYFDKCDAKGNGMSLKGQIHLLGARCELKVPIQKKHPSVWIVEVNSKQEDNKDLLLSFDSQSKAYDWFDSISWTIYLVNNRYINLIHLRPAAHQPTPLHRDIEQWYCQQSFQFEEDFQILSSGCRFNILRQSKEEECYLLGNLDTSSLNWCLLYPEDDQGGSYKRSELKTIQLKEIEDILVGTYSSEEAEAEEEKGDRKPSSLSSSPASASASASKVLSIRTKYFTLDFLYPTKQTNESSARTDRWIQSLISVIHFLAIPVPLSACLSKFYLHDQIKKHYKTIPSSFLAEEQATAILTA